jgi:phosphate acetyltransferase
MSESMERSPQTPRILDTIYERAREAHARIILAESEDERVTEAAERIRQEGLADLTLLDRHSYEQLPDNEKDELAELVKEARAKDGLTLEAARELLASDTKYLAAALVKAGKADGYVAGNLGATSDTIRPALKLLREPGEFASSFFIMLFRNQPLFFADCGFNRDPNAEQLAEIAVDTARNAQTLGIEPRIAFLSFSTAGSADHPHVDKVRSAIAQARALAPDLTIGEHEMQFDAAFIPEIGARKVPGSDVAGSANVLIFPDLNSGNIAYKIAERMGGAQAIGPIFQGFNAPVNDLSRGCSVKDIVDVVAVTAMQAGALKEAREHGSRSE